MKKLPHLPNLESRIYYSQNREDLILSSFFWGKEKGFYVDVGAYDPEYDSVTKLFYEKGWRGINIEPQPDRYKKFIKSRPKDINLNIGVSEKESMLQLRSYSNEGLSTFSKEMKDEYANTQRQDYATEHFTDINVKVKTLAQIFKEQEVSFIDFLKIDVEGLEYEVVAGNDWKKYRPQVLCIESNHIVKNWKKIIEVNGYELVFNDGLNDYFVDNKNSIKMDYIKYVVEDRGGGLRADDFEIMKNYETYLGHYINVTSKADVELKYKEYEKFLLNEKLLKFQSIKYSIRHLVTMLKKRIVGDK